MTDRIVTADDVKRLKVRNAEAATARSKWLRGEGPEPKSALTQRLEGIRRANLGNLAPNAATTGAQRITASAPPASRLSQADVDRAVSSALKAERTAVARLLEDPGASGRCKVIAALIGTTHTASHIRTMLEAGALPSDRAIADKLAGQRAAAVQDTWAKAYGRAFGKRQPVDANSGNPWDKVAAGMAPGGGQKRA